MNHFKAILFDLNGTLIDIWTDETREDLFRTMANLLNTFGMMLSAEEFRKLFYEIMKKQRDERKVEHPEFDAVGIFCTLLKEYGNEFTAVLPKNKLSMLPVFLAQSFRAASMYRLAEYPGVHRILDELQKEYTLAAVSDGQKIWAEAELQRLDLTRYFPVRVISSDYGFRKPAPGLFMAALDELKLEPKDVIYVGNDMYRDVLGSKKLGMKNIYFQSNQGDQRYHGYDSDYIIYRIEDLLTAVHFLEENTEV